MLRKIVSSCFVVAAAWSLFALSPPGGTLSAANCDQNCFETNIWGTCNDIFAGDSCWRYVRNVNGTFTNVNVCQPNGWSTGGDAAKTCRATGGAPLDIAKYANCTASCTGCNGAGDSLQMAIGTFDTTTIGGIDEYKCGNSNTP
jgi:hypothetical protein